MKWKRARRFVKKILKGTLCGRVCRRQINASYNEAEHEKTRELTGAAAEQGSIRAPLSLIQNLLAIPQRGT